MERETTQAPAGNTLVKRPDDLTEGISWRRITVLTLRAGQPRPYADSVYEYLVTFEGGSRSTVEGFDLPFATRGHRDELRAVVHSWDADSREACKSVGDSWLDLFEIVEDEDTHTTYRVRVISPFMD